MIGAHETHEAAARYARRQARAYEQRAERTEVDYPTPAGLMVAEQERSVARTWISEAEYHEARAQLEASA